MLVTVAVVLLLAGAGWRAVQGVQDIRAHQHQGTTISTR